MAKSPVTPRDNNTFTKKRKTPPKTLLPTPKRLNFTPTSPEPVEPGPSTTPTTVGRPRNLKPTTHSSSLSAQNAPTTSRRYVSKIPPPKDWNVPLERHVEGEDSDYEGEEYEHLGIMYYDQVRARLAEAENQELNSGTQDRNRSKMLQQVKWIKGTWNLYNVAALYRFIYSDEEFGPDGKARDVPWCLRRQVRDLAQTLKTKKKTVFKQYKRTSVVAQPFWGFESVRSPHDESAYFFKVFGLKHDETVWYELCTIILGSLGTHELEALSNIQGEQFAYYPFVLARGDNSVLEEVFQHLSERHGYKIGKRHGFRRSHFSSADMWRILTCCVFFIQRLRKSHVVKLTIRHGKNSEDVEWNFDLVDIVRIIQRRRLVLATDDAPKKHYMTARQIGLVREAVKSAYREKFEKDWNKKKTSLRKVEMHHLNITCDGHLQSKEHNEAVAFLYYISRFQTRTYIHPTHGINFDAVNPGLEEYAEDETDVENTGFSSRINSLFENDRTYV